MASEGPFVPESGVSVAGRFRIRAVMLATATRLSAVPSLTAALITRVVVSALPAGLENVTARKAAW